MIYAVGRQLFNKQVGLVAALILALSSFNITYSQEARMYTLMVLLALLSMYFFWRFLQQSNLVSSSRLCSLNNAFGVDAQLWLVCRHCPEHLRRDSASAINGSHVSAEALGRAASDRCSAFCSVDGRLGPTNLAALSNGIQFSTPYNSRFYLHIFWLFRHGSVVSAISGVVGTLLIRDIKKYAVRWIGKLL